MSQETDPVVDDKFVDLMNAKAEVDLRLSDFHPRTALKTAVRCRLIQPRQWPDERTDWISVIAESCDSFQPP